MAAKDSTEIDISTAEWTDLAARIINWRMITTAAAVIIIIRSWIIQYYYCEAVS